MEQDLFGNDIIKDVLLRDKFIEPPFTILDSRGDNWKKRKRKWLQKGILSEVGRETMAMNFSSNISDKSIVINADNNNHWKQGTKDFVKKMAGKSNGISVFDPALCEVLYHWFCDEGGTILDPFAGGSVRGIVANYLGYKYTGIDIRQEQVDSNREQAMDILPIENQPQWYVGDSNELLNDNWNTIFDMIMSCPPYADLEVYSDLKGDISNKPYKQFLELYESIISKSCKLLKVGGYACFVVGEVRQNHKGYYGFIPDTINAFKKCGMTYYNEAIYITSFGNAGMRANRYMGSQKLVKVHQNVLVFKK
jgi:DNA modification methylase